MSTQPRFRIASFGRQLTTFDLLLAAIPLVLLAGVLSAHLFAVPQFVGTAVGAGLAGSLVGYGIYVMTRLRSRAIDSEPSLHRGAGRVG